MTISLLLDIDVIIDYMRGRAESVAYMSGLPTPFFISAITVAELYAGVREGAERAALDEAVSTAFTVVPVDSTIAAAGGLYRRTYGKSHGTSLADALIAATATIHGATLVTLNKKHFPMLPNVIIPYQKP